MSSSNIRKSSEFVPNSDATIIQEMLDESGISSVEELFKDVPGDIRLKRPLSVPGPFPEWVVEKNVAGMLSRNRAPRLSFLGGGVASHYIPSEVFEITGRSEFYTSYTPYQPSATQGMLQSLFEYQSMICELTGCGVANCSMYDGASALGEAALMAARITCGSKFLVPARMDPQWKEVLKVYCVGSGVEVIEFECDENGLPVLESIPTKMEGISGIYVENPTFEGLIVADLNEFAELAHSMKALLVVGVDPISLGILEGPGNLGADIVIGEGQPLGSPVNFGGPLLGIFACRDKNQNVVRKMPGRIIGMTKDSAGRRAFCMTFQTREQHIRREKATSNICSNEALQALTAAAYLAVVGGTGLKRIAECCAGNCEYLIKELSNAGFSVPSKGLPHFKEFVLVNEKMNDISRKVLEKYNIASGIIISDEKLLVCTTELHSKEDLDDFVKAMTAARKEVTGA